MPLKILKAGGASTSAFVSQFRKPLLYPAELRGPEDFLARALASRYMVAHLA